jgi:hypothetical protein
MRSGFESKRNVVILSVLGIVMVGAGAYFVSTMFGGSPAPTAAAVPPAESAPQTGPRNENGHAAQKLPPLEKLDPTLHPEVMAGAEALEYSGKGRNIFSLVSAPVEIPKALGPVRTVAVVPQAPAGPPPPPPIDLKFFGYSAENGARKAFLLHGDDVFIAIEGDVVDHHYKVVKISPVSIQVTDLLYNNTQTLPLTQS